MDLRIDTIGFGQRPDKSSEAAATLSKQETRLDQAATDFEGLLVSQMLRHARQAGDGGWLGTGEDQAGDTMMEMAEECLARIMASHGCLGLASMMKQGVLNEAKPRQVSPIQPDTRPRADRLYR